MITFELHSSDLEDLITEMLDERIDNDIIPLLDDLTDKNTELEKELVKIRSNLNYLLGRSKSPFADMAKSAFQRLRELATWRRIR